MKSEQHAAHKKKLVKERRRAVIRSLVMSTSMFICAMLISPAIMLLAYGVAIVSWFNYLGFMFGFVVIYWMFTRSISHDMALVATHTAQIRTYEEHGI